MAKVHSLRIQNFRGIQNFEYSFKDAGFVCLIGRGDSGKSTILEAISMVLSPNWNMSFYDTDFYNSEIDNPIVIEAVVYDLPETLLRESKFGLHIREIDPASYEIMPDVQQLEAGVDPVLCLTIRLEVKKDLEPKWSVVNHVTGEQIPISANDRASMNVFLVSDYVDRHFSWNRGNPLFSILKQREAGGADEDQESVVLTAMRSAKNLIDGEGFAELQEVIANIKDKVQSFGTTIRDAKTSIDFKDIAIKDGRICLHDGSIPLRMKGKGSKRLISTAIQFSLIQGGGIILIDEIEQGLEPDRVQNFVSLLKKHTDSQIFIATHSRDVVVELEAKDIFRLPPDKKTLVRFDDTQQATIRKNPEALFANGIIVCEGATEVGIIRAFDNFLKEQDGHGLSYYGVRCADGTGSGLVGYCKSFSKAGYAVCLFCDSDDDGINRQKEELRRLGVTIADCDEGLCIEKQIFQDLSWAQISVIVEYGESIKSDSVHSNINAYGGNMDDPAWFDEGTENIRTILGNAAVHKTSKADGSQKEDKSWFKRTDHGIELGNVICADFENPPVSQIYKQLNVIRGWLLLT